MSTKEVTGDLFVEKSLDTQDTIDGHKPKDTVSLETGLEQLEKIVKTLEQKDLPLENALSLFKEGVGLVQYCSNVLNQAEKQMEILLEGPDGSLQIKPVSLEMEG
ncbi:MAG TPA: exodeoxyribonuclease VII small subunit [Desulfosporosinus sp.]|nr:exodeoxyribonuclease VII small subunit [Desulfosporosinus sp.]